MAAAPLPHLTCPACGTDNEASACFCKNDKCHKALGEFHYALEELGKQSKWHMGLATKLGGFVGQPSFVLFHVAWIGLWVALNTGVITMGRVFDPYPFGLLALLLGIEAVLITSILIISSSAAANLAQKRAELDYEVNVQTYREIQAILKSLDAISGRLGRNDL